MKNLRTAQLCIATALATLLAGAFAFDLHQGRERAERALEQEFNRRATLAASLTRATLRSTVSGMRETLSGSPRALRRVLASGRLQVPGSRMTVLDADGAVLAARPRGAATAALAHSPVAQRALGGEPAISNLQRADRRGGGFVTIAIPADGPDGRRVAVIELPVQVVQGFAAGYLASAPATAGGRGYLVDAAGLTISASEPFAAGRPLPDRALAAALATRAAGPYGDDRQFAAAPILGTGWRVVLAAPRGALLAPVSGATRRSAVLFAAFVAALGGLVATGAAALRTSSTLAGTRERERAARRLAHERLHDALTGLPNRALLLDRAAHALRRAERTRRALALLFVDLDHFKRVNDSLGHASGDELLVAIGRRLADALRPLDTVGRFGGDEFLVLCTDLRGVDDALAIADRVTAALERPFTLGTRRLDLSCCVGVAMHVPGERDAGDADALVRDADAAMYRAKATGPGTVRVFDAELRGEALRRLDTEVALRSAIEAELRVHYQPIVTLPEGRLRGVEALVRWERPGVGLVAPAEFIPIAEESGLIGRIGERVLELAMEEVGGWRSAGIIDQDFVLSVNVSARQLCGEGLRVAVAGLLESWPLPARGLWLEITESAVAADPEGARRQLRRLSALGVHVAIDDFGVGQSSLEQLAHALPVDVLKLDRRFTSSLGRTRERAIAAAVAPLAAALRMTAVAEGVECAEQAAELSALGFPLAQGFHFGRPVEGGVMRELLADTMARPAGTVPARSASVGA